LSHFCRNFFGDSFPQKYGVGLGAEKAKI